MPLSSYKDTDNYGLKREGERKQKGQTESEHSRRSDTYITLICVFCLFGILFVLHSSSFFFLGWCVSKFFSRLNLSVVLTCVDIKAFVAARTRISSSHLFTHTNTQSEQHTHIAETTHSSKRCVI